MVNKQWTVLDEVVNFFIFIVFYFFIHSLFIKFIQSYFPFTKNNCFFSGFFLQLEINKTLSSVFTKTKKKKTFFAVLKNNCCSTTENTISASATVTFVGGGTANGNCHRIQ